MVYCYYKYSDLPAVSRSSILIKVRNPLLYLKVYYLVVRYLPDIINTLNWCSI